MRPVRDKSEPEASKGTDEDIEYLYEKTKRSRLTLPRVKEEVEGDPKENLDFQKGEELLAKRKLDEAWDCFQKAADNDGPAKRFGLIGMSKVCLEKKDFLKAKLHASESLIGNSNIFDGWFHSAKASIGLSDSESEQKKVTNYVKDALKALDKCKVLNPQHAEVLNMQGKLYERLNDHDRAIRAYTESLDIEVNPDVLLARGKIYFQLKNYKSAADNAMALLELKQNDFDALLLKGDVLAEQKEHEQAITCFVQCDTLKPNNFQVQEKLVDQYMAVQEFDKAIEICNKACSQKMCPNSFWVKKTTIYMERRQYDLAFSAVAEAKSMAKGETHEMKPTTSKVTPKTDVETVSDVVPREIKGQIPVVKQAQMSKKLRQAAITCIKEAFGKFTCETEIAQFIKDQFDKKHKSTWQCILGNDLVYYLEHDDGCYVHLLVGQLEVLLFKTGLVK
ncbi:dynein light chain type 1 domain-containing protein [Ditylenchus destructor]|uniref:Dynein light chain 1, cytoplasmic n=1 Tax=Ditylenchus destructor TaxID=166010 RepID=A0AAD4N0N5_9BILA|nr:dynein light chain type 1 domain-containing protein [Ditylenchus destructor]